MSLKHVDYKVPGGKLLRIDADIDGESIRKLKLTGDFFVHPEVEIRHIEALLEGTDMGSVVPRLDEYIKRKGIQLIGFSPADVYHALEELLHQQKSGGC